MQILKSTLAIVVFAVSVSVFAQSGEDAAQAKRDRLNAILGDSLAEVQALKLPENRAVFYSRIGNLVWPQDQKSARNLFRKAAAELANAQAYAESKRAVNPYNELLQGNNTRQQILNTIANRDAELALELLASTRPINVQRAMETPTEKPQKISNFRQNNAYLAQNESYMEQNFYRMAAEQSPERAVKLLKESLSKGLTNDTYNQLDRLAQKDEPAAAEMSSQVVDKLLRSSYLTEEQPNYVHIQLTNTILSNYMSRRPDDGRKLKFDAAQMNELASKLINAFLSDQRLAGSIGQSVVSIAEKMQPSSLGSVRKVIDRIYPQNGGSGIDAAYQKLMSGDTPVEEMLGAAEKFPMQTRRQIYQNASNKLMNQGNWQAAREVITENFAEDDTDNALVNFDQQLVYNLVSQGKFGDAENIIDGLPVQNRVPLLVNLANSIFNRDQEKNRAYASSVLGKARQLVNEKPENSSELGTLLHVIGGYISIEPSEAFRLFENIVPKYIELLDAAAVLNGFVANSNVREGEYVVTQSNPLDQFGGSAYVFGSFARSDLERTMNLIDSFKRPEIRLSLKLQLLDGSELTSVPVSGRQIVELPVNVVRRK